MTDIAKAYVQIVPSAKGIAGSISNVLDGESEKAGTSAGQKIAQMLKKAILGAGVGKAIQASLLEGGALQQSFIGGLDTLYGDAADQMREYATAAAAAGISANSYAEQAVSFGAALKKSFEGAEDAELRAGEAANLAIMDMADNAAKMGTDLGSIQAAYQGFAKQNYTMLDNLKLGYGGTKTEMERLLKDAEKLSGVHYDIDNLADVYSAIHVIQEDLGLTNVAAKEASETLTGSFGAVKASLQNLMGFMSLGIDLTPALTQLQTSLNAFLFNNLIPMFSNIITAVPDLMSNLIGTVIGFLNQGALKTDGMVSVAINFVTSLGTNLISQAPYLIEAAFNLLGSLGASLVNFDWSTWASETLSNLSNNLSVMFDELGVPTTLEGAVRMVAGFIAGIAQRLPSILQEGITLIGQFIAGMIAAIPDILRRIPEIIQSIKRGFENFDWKTIGTNIIKGVANGIKNAGSIIVNAAKDAAKSAFEAAKNFLNIGSPSKLMEKEVGRQISAGMAIGITKNTDLIESAMHDAVAVTDLRGYSMKGDLTIGNGFGSQGNGFTQNITVNAPTELSPSEIARQTRNATRQMALSMSGVI